LEADNYAPVGLLLEAALVLDHVVCAEEVEHGKSSLDLLLTALTEWNH
jgi:hypothetical protein